MNRLQQLLNLIFLPLVIIGAVFLVKGWIAGKPERVVKKPPVVVPRAEYVARSLGTETPTISTFGTTQSFFETTISAQVAGELQQVSAQFNTGNRVSRGDLLAEIDPADFLTAIAESETNLSQAKQTLAEEKTLSALAAEDWVDSGRRLADAAEFTLRKPQLAAAEATVTSAEAQLQQARLNLERTKVRAPFDAIVTARNASPGNVVSVGLSLGALVSRDKAEVRLPLTPEQVALVKIPVSGTSLNPEDATVARVRTPSQPGKEWEARLVRTEPGVDLQNQVIYVIGQIEKPFEDADQFLPLGAFVNVEIVGKPISDCYHIPATALVEDSFVWVIGEDETLRKVPAKRLYSSKELNLVSLQDATLEDPVHISTRPLASFIEGEKVEPEELEVPADER